MQSSAPFEFSNELRAHFVRTQIKPTKKAQLSIQMLKKLKTLDKNTKTQKTRVFFKITQLLQDNKYINYLQIRLLIIIKTNKINLDEFSFNFNF